ncbi:hypothetical protein BB561_000548 [Smittium simulii]|uniref:Uncharacterized protein n=1 Tax=Smittium simulii TaxID=133385 RepID=A0A2T9YYN1_9FUNG|nr:hypothetical protein BB561_000548 [Smittium simulii]
MSNIPGVNQSAATKLPFPSAKSTRLEYNTVAKTAITYRGCTSICSFTNSKGIGSLIALRYKNLNKVSLKIKKKASKNAQKISQNIVGLAPKSAMDKAQKQPTSLEKLAENSNRLGELQKLATEQKSEQKNSKEKDEWGKSDDNNVKSGIHIGPKINDELLELLFADDADMNVNNKKCSIMAINCSADTTFKIQNQPIPTIKEYKCFGVELNNEWNSKSFFKAKKWRLLKVIWDATVMIQVFATYGGELFGMSATRCKPIQQVVDKQL